MDELVDEGEVLDRQRAVEPVLVVEVRDRDRRRPRAEDRAGEVPRDEVLKDEREQGHADEDDHRLEEPPENETDHVAQLVRVTFDNPVG